jgi:hypothetical protein
MSIVSNAYPLLLLLTESAESESLPQHWIDDIANGFITLLALIDEQWVSATNEEYVSLLRVKLI